MLTLVTDDKPHISPAKLRVPLQTVILVSIIFVQSVAFGVVRSFVPDLREIVFWKVVFFRMQ